ncbi:hypothetical protein BCR34DRAFT_70643 [Clohesyomyces aquaticus]|uniref:Uncharacterized protein n=1 Tax=Clohesyomyces aquaticus TaxID=1231657 RepID=A0A1Y1YZG1_9PLEO|nr:hypothetical protein BCR34DRAFT_70643 [Clohesyomyces aquaticus]
MHRSASLFSKICTNLNLVCFHSTTMKSFASLTPPLALQLPTVANNTPHRTHCTRMLTISWGRPSPNFAHDNPSISKHPAGSKQAQTLPLSHTHATDTSLHQQTFLHRLVDGHASRCGNSCTRHSILHQTYRSWRTRRWVWLGSGAAGRRLRESDMSIV